MKFNKIKRRVLSCLMVGIFTVSFLNFNKVTSFADTDTKSLQFSAINLKIEVPSELICFTQSTTNNNSYLELIGASDASEVQTSMIANNCYLEAVDADMTYELAITGVKANESLSDFNTLSESDLNSLFDSYIESESNLETEYKEEEILDSGIEYFNDQPYFMTYNISTTTEGVVVYATKYYTVANGYIYNFAIQTNTDSVTDEMLANMAVVLNSAKYTEVKSSILENGVVSETLSVIITAAIPVAILALLVYFIRVGNKKKQNKLIKEELEIKKRRGV
ncbi:hypothetical protein [Lachnospira multipara]|uniref:Pilin isopeptide linkage domain-containing protein n=1 Tax=Lachnospira multipara TaxID=28051 RepID=A0A1H5RLM7_9FIRM|nr:hypothetical protein [Lachnospira multipara]SEF39263.1 hypothetical protein SAMN05216537_101144 [Lachnospira multipara]